jgi:hypothetical protein
VSKILGSYETKKTLINKIPLKLKADNIEIKWNKKGSGVLLFVILISKET